MYKYKLTSKIQQLREEEEASKPQYTIYCDMDGVIADFDKRFEQFFKMSPREYESKFGKEQFWEGIAKEGVKFWVGIPWMPQGKQLWDYIKQYNPTLLSAPSRENESRLGKRLWVKNNIPGTKLILASRETKQNYSKPNKILIDDRPDTIEEWNARGGTGILFISTEQTINDLKQLGL
jgi:hypothetical protein